jgi:hypothetical protein
MHNMLAIALGCLLHSFYLTPYFKLDYINSAVYRTKQCFTRPYVCSVRPTLAKWSLSTFLAIGYGGTHNNLGTSFLSCSLLGDWSLACHVYEPSPPTIVEAHWSPVVFEASPHPRVLWCGALHLSDRAPLEGVLHIQCIVSSAKNHHLLQTWCLATATMNNQQGARYIRTCVVYGCRFRRGCERVAGSGTSPSYLLLASCLGDL